MSLYEIRASLDTDPNWYVLPSHLRALKNKIDAYLAGDMPENPDDPDENTPFELPPDTCVIGVRGAIVKRTGASQEVCDIVGLCDLDHVSRNVKAVLGNQAIRNVVLAFDSPGGYTVGLPECSALISELASVKWVFPYSDTCCASAAYELYAQGTACYCSPSAILGSVGTVGTYTNVSEALKMQGIDVKLITSGKYKALTDPEHAPLKEDEIKYLTDGVLKEANRFKASVLSKRTIKDEYLQGQTFSGVEAVQNNFADGLFNDLESLIRFISRLNIYSQGI